MTVEANKALVRQFIEQVYNHKSIEAIADYCVPGSMLAGGLAGQMMSMKSAFPDNHFTIEKLVAEEDHVVAVLTARGTNSGPIVGLPGVGKLEKPLPPTGKTIVTGSFMLFILKDGKIQSIAPLNDDLGMLRQLDWLIAPPKTADES